MSTTQRTDACVITVDHDSAEVLREQTLVVLEANHEYFEDVRAFSPPAQRALATVYRDAFAVLDALHWGMPAGAGAAATIDVALTDGHADRLRRCGYDLRRAILDRLAVRDRSSSPQEIAELDVAIAADRLAALTLDRIVGTRQP